MALPALVEDGFTEAYYASQEFNAAARKGLTRVAREWAIHAYNVIEATRVHCETDEDRATVDNALASIRERFAPKR